MALHPDFPELPYVVLPPGQRWFPADEALRGTAYEKLLPPPFARIREEVGDWREDGYKAHHIHHARLPWFKGAA